MRRRKIRRPAAAVAFGLFLLGSSLLCGPAWGQGEIFPLEEVRPGLTGYGLSVFSGTEPERFEVEVIGVWKNVRPGLSYILARLSEQGLENSGVVAGMSGSPVFFDGRPAGAVAFSWAFAKEAIAGITPLGNMRQLIGAAPDGDLSAVGALDFSLAELASGELSRETLDRAIGDLLSSGRGAARGATALGWVASGFGEASRELLAKSAVSLGNGGSVTDGQIAQLGPGGSVAAVLIDGDLKLAAGGTVTDRVGDTVLAFGHAFLGVGELRLPMAAAEVLTVIPSQANSFKITNVGQTVGAFDFDHETGIRGRIGAEAPMIPVNIALQGHGGGNDLAVRVADLDTLTPTLVAIALLGALDTADRALGSEGIDLTARFDLGPHGPLEIEQTFDGAASSIESALHLLAVTAYLLGNPLEEAALSGLDIEVVRHPRPRAIRLLGAHADRTLLEPGQQVQLNLELAEYRGETRRRSIQVDLPADLPEGRYSLLVGDGVSLDAARLAVEKWEPATFEQALEFLESLHSRRDLVVAGVLASPGLTVAGEVLPQLPGSVRSLWGAAGSTAAKPLELAVVQQETLRLPAPLEGAVRVDLEVKRSDATSNETGK